MLLLNIILHIAETGLTIAGMFVGLVIATGLAKGAVHAVEYWQGLFK